MRARLKQISIECVIKLDGMLQMSSSNVIFESAPFSRVTEVTVKGKKLVTPTFFPAVSSYGIKYSFEALVRLLTVYSYPRLLVSAYDFYLLNDKKKKELSQEMSEYSQKGCFVFLDSGIYESSWKADSRWIYDRYKASISQVSFDFYSSFDVLPPRTKSSLEEFFEATFESILVSSNLSKGYGFIPILHGANPEQLVSLVAKFVDVSPNLCDMIAVAERDCGNNIVEKARTILKLRSILNGSNCPRLLHILGCGNPKSLVLFSYCGADMFDSLDWIKYVVDRVRLTINDFSHLELINCSCPICSRKKGDYIESALLHNLLFYQDYMQQIQFLIREKKISEFISEHLGQDILGKINA